MKPIYAHIHRIVHNTCRLESLNKTKKLKVMFDLILSVLWNGVSAMILPQLWDAIWWNGQGTKKNTTGVLSHRTSILRVHFPHVTRNDIFRSLNDFSFLWQHSLYLFRWSQTWMCCIHCARLPRQSRSTKCQYQAVESVPVHSNCDNHRRRLQPTCSTPTTIQWLIAFPDPCMQSERAPIYYMPQQNLRQNVILI